MYLSERDGIYLHILTYTRTFLLQNVTHTHTHISTCGTLTDTVKKDEVCYDAVVPADETLTLMEDSPQLSGLLLRTFGGLSGKSLLDFCSKDDHDRILEHFESSLAKGAPVMALHVDMLDSDQNHLKVELLHARFTNLSNERCFLIGVREMQFLDVGPAPLEQSSFQHLRPPVEAVKVHDLMLTFDVPTFEILSLSSSLEGLCQQMAMEKVDTSCNFSIFQHFVTIIILSDVYIQ